MTIYNQMLWINQQEGLQVPYHYQLLSSIYLSLTEGKVAGYIAFSKTTLKFLKNIIKVI